MIKFIVKFRRYSFCVKKDPNNKDFDNVTVNIDNIRRKLLQERETKLPLRDSRIHIPGNVYDSKSNKR